jgi:hypothetical protein
VKGNTLCRTYCSIVSDGCSFYLFGGASFDSSIGFGYDDLYRLTPDEDNWVDHSVAWEKIAKPKNEGRQLLPDVAPMFDRIGIKNGPD